MIASSTSPVSDLPGTLPRANKQIIKLAKLHKFFSRTTRFTTGLSKEWLMLFLAFLCVRWLLRHFLPCTPCSLGIDTPRSCMYGLFSPFTELSVIYRAFGPLGTRIAVIITLLPVISTFGRPPLEAWNESVKSLNRNMIWNRCPSDEESGVLWRYLGTYHLYEDSCCFDLRRH